MNKNVSWLILLIIAIVVWALTDFSLDVVTVLAKILGVYAVITAILATEKAMRERFSKTPSESPIKELIASSKPVMVQIVYPEPPKVEKTEVLKSIRLLDNSTSREQVEEAVKNVLGERSESFWKQVGASAISSSLAKNNFWLEGLVLIFEQNNGSIPKNDGRVLAQILLNQWNKEKLGSDQAVSLDVLQKQLGGIALRDFPQLKYPEYHEGRVRSLYTEYELLVYRIGQESSSDRFNLSRMFLIWLLARFSTDPEQFFRSLENTKEPWRTLLNSALYILLDPFRFLLTLIISSFIWVEIKIGDLVGIKRGADFFRYRLDSIWEEYKIFELRVRRFFDSISIRKNRTMRKGRSIIATGETTGILGTDGEHIWFTEDYWRDYFAVWQAINTSSLEDFLKKFVNNRYRRQYPSEGDKVAIMASGLYKMPADGVKLVFGYDPIAASKCLLTLDDIPIELQDSLKLRMLESIVKNLEEVPSDGNTRFCLDSIRAMRSLSDSPYYAKIALEKIPKIYHYESRPVAAKMVASFGPPVFDTMKEKLTTDDPFFLRNILIALGELRDERAIPLLKKVLEETTEIRVKLMSVVVLATYFKDETGIHDLEKFLRFEYPEQKKYYPWTDFDISGEDAVAFGLEVLVRASIPPEDEQTRDPWHLMTEDFMKALKGRYKHNSRVEAMLLEILEDPVKDRLKVFVIEALGNVQGSNAIPKLVSYLRDDDDYVRKMAMRALKQIGKADLCSELTGLLILSDPYLVKEAIDGLATLTCLDAIPALIEKLNGEEIEILYPNDEGYPIALYAVEALIKIGKNIREEQSPNPTRKSAGERCLKAATDWCNAHLGDRRSLRASYKNVTYRSLFLLNFEIPTKAALNYYSAWVNEHPDDGF